MKTKPPHTRQNPAKASFMLFYLKRRQVSINPASLVFPKSDVTVPQKTAPDDRFRAGLFSFSSYLKSLYFSP